MIAVVACGVDVEKQGELVEIGIIVPRATSDATFNPIIDARLDTLVGKSLSLFKWRLPADLAAGLLAGLGALSDTYDHDPPKVPGTYEVVVAGVTVERVETDTAVTVRDFVILLSPTLTTLLTSALRKVVETNERKDTK